MFRFTLATLAALIVVAVSGNAVPAAVVIYTDGPPSGGFYGGYFAFQAFSTSDSFTASSAYTLTSLTGVNLLTTEGAPTSISWTIGTAPFTADISSGTSSITNTALGTGGPYTMYDSSLPISGTVSAGTYWLTLLNGHPDTYWNATGYGTSTAYQSNDLVNPIRNSPFTVNGSTAVPEPSTFVVWAGLGFVGLGVVALRKKYCAA